VQIAGACRIDDDTGQLWIVSEWRHFHREELAATSRQLLGALTRKRYTILSSELERSRDGESKARKGGSDTVCILVLLPAIAPCWVQMRGEDREASHGVLIACAGLLLARRT
jgi:hypothetical protein